MHLHSAKAKSLPLYGRVYGHPKVEDGKEVRTSPIISHQGKYVTTQSGTVYFLEEPALVLLDQLARAGLQYNSENPLHFEKKIT